jgi:hypothetical protein
MSWIEKLSEHGKKQKQKKSSPPSATPATPPTVHWCCVSVRPSNESGDPGEIAEGHYTITDGMIVLTDQDGRPLAEAKAEAMADGVDPRRIAQRMLRNLWNKGGRGGFWRQLPSNGWDAPA